MTVPRRLLNVLVALALALGQAAGAAGAQPAAAGEAAGEDALAALFEALRDPGEAGWTRVEARIRRAWSRSGSPAMDLLLTRGQQALEEGDLAAAVEHLTALTDHAPGFAEGWHARATAFYLSGRFGPALDDLRMALALEPRHFGALAGLGLIAEESGMAAAARAAYEAALAIHPHLQAARDGLARVERAAGGQAI